MSKFALFVEQKIFLYLFMCAQKFFKKRVQTWFVEHNYAGPFLVDIVGKDYLKLLG